ncbi:MAG: histidine phosphatase family protein [bacterium]
MSDDTTVVHVLRHGEVHNPEGVLYGRLPGFRLSDRGEQMAERVAKAMHDRDVTYIVSSPLERAQQTAAPIAAVHGLDIATDERLIEAGNVFEGQRVGVGDGVLRTPSAWRHLWNPFTPSWGEPYREIADRMSQAVLAARDQARGHEALIVSHQLPIWIARLHAGNERLWHDPRKRECSLASVTSFHFDGDRLAEIAYDEPARDLLPGGSGAGPRGA